MSSDRRDAIAAHDRAVYEAAGYGQRGRRGRSRALLSIAEISHPSGIVSP